MPEDEVRRKVYCTDYQVTDTGDSVVYKGRLSEKRLADGRLSGVRNEVVLDKKLYAVERVGVDIDTKEQAVQFGVIGSDDEFEGPCRYEWERIKYIGDETDGSRLPALDGLVDGSGVYAGSKLRTIAPMSADLVYADGMYEGCTELTRAEFTMRDGNGRLHSAFPPNLTSASYMFAGCKNMVDGPRTIGGDCQDISFMFAGCAKLQRPPTLEAGILNMDGCFMRSGITEKPYIPITVTHRDGVTYGCDSLDRSEDIRMKQQLSAIEQNIKKESALKRAPGGKVANTLTAIIQYGSFRMMKMSPVMAYAALKILRHDGMLKTHGLDAVIGPLALAKGSPIGRIMLANSAWSSRKDQADAQRAARREARYMSRLALGPGYNGSYDAVKKMFGYNADQKAAENKAVSDVGGRWHSPKSHAASNNDLSKHNLVYRIAWGMDDDMRREVEIEYGRPEVFIEFEDNMQTALNESGEDGRLSDEDREAFCTFYTQEVQWRCTYLNEVRNELMERRDRPKSEGGPEYSPEQWSRIEDGFDMLTDYVLGPLRDSVCNAQAKYHLFDERDIREFNQASRASACYDIMPRSVWNELQEGLVRDSTNERRNRHRQGIAGLDFHEAENDGPDGPSPV